MDHKITIGGVIYTETTIGIQAEWYFYKEGKVEQGTGIGIRLTPPNEKRKFEGEYKIIYSDTEGRELAKLHLKIVFEAEYYKLSWKHKEKITDVGIGIERDYQLIASYTEVI